MSDYTPYHLLAGAIIAEQCREYYMIYCRYLSCRPESLKYYTRRVAEMRYNLLNFSWADYMNMDIESVIDEIERKAKKGVRIRWRQRDSYSGF